MDNLGNFSFYATAAAYTYTATGAGLSPYGPVPILAVVPTGGGGSGTISAGVLGQLAEYNSNGSTIGPTPGISSDGNSLSIKGPDPHRDVMAYGASGSTQTTTTSASFTSGSSTLSLTSALDFKNGQQVRIVGPGVVSTLTAPTGLAVTPQGATGATTYQYQVACVDAKWGETPATTAVSIANGNATLTYANFNKVNFSASAGCIYYAIYGRASGSMALLEITPNLVWFDYGQDNVTNGNMAVPSTLSATPPASAQKGFYYGTITAGAGTTTLTMNTASGATVGAGTQVEHDDSAGIQAAINAATTASTGFSLGTQDRIFFPPGNYNVTQPLIPAGNQAGIVFMGSGQATLLSHIVGEAIFLIQTNNQDITWQNLYFILAASNKAIHFTQAAGDNVRTKFDTVSSSGSGAGNNYDTFYQNDGGSIIFNMTRSSIANDVNLRFGEPGLPVQVDDIHTTLSDFYTGPVGTNAIPGTFQFVGNGVSGAIAFRDTLIEGPVPPGTSFPWFRISNAVEMTFQNVEFAPENLTAGTGAMFQGWPGLPTGGGPIVFDQSPLGSIGTGGIFDFSGGAGTNPAIVLRESAAVAGGGAQVWHAASDMNGLSCHNSQISPAQTSLSGRIEAIKCFGFAGFTDNSNQIYLRGLNGADQDPFAMDDSTGSSLVHMDINGAIIPKYIKGIKQAAPTCLSNIGFAWFDTTADAWKFCNDTATPLLVAGFTTLSGWVVGNCVKGGTAPGSIVQDSSTCGGGAGGANTSLSNLAATAINTSLIPGAINTVALGSNTLGYTNLFLCTVVNQCASFDTSALTANRVTKFPDAASSTVRDCPVVTDQFVSAIAQATGTCTKQAIAASATGPNDYVGGAGAVNVMTATLPVVPSSLSTGLEAHVLPNLANTTTTPTLNVNALGAVTIKKFGNAALVAGDYSTTAIAYFIYDGTNWQLQNPQSLATAMSTTSVNTGITNKTIDAEGSGNAISLPIKAFFGAAGCNSSTAGSSFDLGTVNAPTPQCTGTTVRKGVLQFARGNVAYINWHLPADWSSSASTDIELGFTTTDTTNGHITSWNIQTGCNKVDGTTTDDPSLNTLQALSVTTGASQVSGGELAGTKTALTMTGCVADYNFEIVITRNNSGTDTNTDTAVALKFAEITTGVTKNAANR